MDLSHSYILGALIFAAMVVCYAKPPVPEDIGTNFFLKASKSVPRIGRRTMEYENYFLKASKSIPRIGRRTSNSQDEGEGSWIPKISQETVKKSLIGKYYKENGQPTWVDLEKIYPDYQASFQSEEIYPESSTNSKSDNFWPRTKKNKDTSDDQPLRQNE